MLGRDIQSFEAGTFTVYLPKKRRMKRKKNVSTVYEEKKILKSFLSSEQIADRKAEVNMQEESTQLL